MKENLRKTIIILLILISTLPAAAAVQDSLSVLLDRLDVSLSHKGEYEQLKKDRIERLRTLYSESDNVETRYTTACELFEEYKAFRSDSSLVYGRLCVELAQSIGDISDIVRAKCDLAYALISSGISSEANIVLTSIDRATLPASMEKDYYYTYVKYWLEEADDVRDENLYAKFMNQCNEYMDSLLSVLPKESPEYWQHLGSLQMRLGKPELAVPYIKKFLSFHNTPTHERAKGYAELAWAYDWQGMEDKALENFVLSAICDNESCAREITSLYILADRLIGTKEKKRAVKYITIATEYIDFYGASFRKLKLSNILTKIDEERYRSNNLQQMLLLITALLSILFVIALFYVVVTMYRRNFMLAEAEEKERQNHKALEKINHQLQESNILKVEYIGQAFYANAEAITKMAKLCKAIDRLLAVHQYDKIHEAVDSKRFETDRAKLYSVFDSTFLGLFPNFIDEYNKLFDAEHQVVPPAEKTLTAEMRIFALIRLGITNSEKIATFMDYSVHTVNTYKTRIKNKSNVDNDKFEAIIAGI